MPIDGFQPVLAPSPSGGAKTTRAASELVWLEREDLVKEKVLYFLLIYYCP